MNNVKKENVVELSEEDKLTRKLKEYREFSDMLIQEICDDLYGFSLRRHPAFTERVKRLMDIFEKLHQNPTQTFKECASMYQSFLKSRENEMVIGIGTDPALLFEKYDELNEKSLRKNFKKYN